DRITEGALKVISDLPGVELIAMGANPALTNKGRKKVEPLRLGPTIGGGPIEQRSRSAVFEAPGDRVEIGEFGAVDRNAPGDRQEQRRNRAPKGRRAPTATAHTRAQGHPPVASAGGRCGRLVLCATLPVGSAGEKPLTVTVSAL